jgi:tetratricopeptide (TPR) repeat protein
MSDQAAELDTPPKDAADSVEEPSPPPQEAVPALWPYLVLATVVLAIYGRTTTFPLLLWDDETIIVSNPNVAEPSLGGLIRNWTRPHFKLYAPVTYSLWSLEGFAACALPEALGGSPDAVAPVVFRTVTTALVCLLAFQAYRLFRRFASDEWACILGALVVVVHPAAAEAGAWVSENKGLLAGVFGLSALIAYVDAARGEPGRYGWGTVALLLALASKPSAVSIPLIAALVDWGLLRRPPGRIARATALWFACAVAMMLVAMYVQTTARAVDVPWSSRPYVAAHALWFYAKTVAFPVDLLPDYSLTPARVLEGARRPELVGGGALLAVAAGVGLLVALRLRTPATLALWFLAALSTNLGFAPFAYQTVSTVADRYLSPALVPIGLGAALLLDRLRRPAYKAAMAAVLIGWAWLAFHQAGRWRDDETLCSYTVARNPNSFMFWTNRSIDRWRRDRLDDAIADAEKALALRPDFVPSRVNLVRMLLQAGRVDRATAVVEEGLRSRPDDEVLLEAAMAALGAQGRYEDALDRARRILESPDPVRGRIRYGNLMILSGRTREGLDAVNAARGSRMQPIEEEAYVAQVYEDAGEFQRAAEARRVIADRLGVRGAASHVRLAWILATAPDEQARRPDEALARLLRLKERLEQEGERPTPEFWDALAATYAAAGRFEEASQTARQAAWAARAAGDAPLARAIRFRRKMYDAGRPYVAPRSAWIGSPGGR